MNEFQRAEREARKLRLIERDMQRRLKAIVEQRLEAESKVASMKDHAVETTGDRTISSFAH